MIAEVWRDLPRNWPVIPMLGGGVAFWLLLLRSYHPAWAMAAMFAGMVPLIVQANRAGETRDAATAPDMAGGAHTENPAENTAPDPRQTAVSQPVI